MEDRMRLDPTSAIQHEMSPRMLRDWFAGQALQGMLASESTKVAAQKLAGSFVANVDVELSAMIARTAYLMADALIAAREK